jgi:hypothetical protein
VEVGRIAGQNDDATRRMRLQLIVVELIAQANVENAGHDCVDPILGVSMWHYLHAGGHFHSDHVGARLRRVTDNDGEAGRRGNAANGSQSISSGRTDLKSASPGWWDRVMAVLLHENFPIVVDEIATDCRQLRCGRHFLGVSAGAWFGIVRVWLTRGGIRSDSLVGHQRRHAAAHEKAAPATTQCRRAVKLNQGGVTEPACRLRYECPGIYRNLSRSTSAAKLS